MLQRGYGTNRDFGGVCPTKLLLLALNGESQARGVQPVFINYLNLKVKVGLLCLYNNSYLLNNIIIA